MDPRLKRWGVVALASALFALCILLPGGAPILGEWNELPEQLPTAPLLSRKMAIGLAWEATNDRIEAIKRRRTIQAAMSDRSDPLILSSEGVPNSRIAQVRKAAQEVWSSLPQRRGEIRTVLDVRDYWRGGYRVPELDADGNCIAVTGAWGSQGESERDLILELGGECLFREAFGAPGPAWRAWKEKTPSRWTAWPGARLRLWERYVSNNPSTRAPAWFEFAGPDVTMMSMSRMPVITPLQLAYSACRAGRVDQCRLAYQVDSAGVLTAELHDGSRSAPTWRLSGALLVDLGPARFAELWRTDLPISTAYQRLAGRPIDQLLTDVTMRASGPRPRETALPLLSWFALVVWGGLLVLWAHERLRARVIS